MNNNTLINNPNPTASKTCKNLSEICPERMLLPAICFGYSSQFLPQSSENSNLYRPKVTNLPNFTTGASHRFRDLGTLPHLSQCVLGDCRCDTGCGQTSKKPQEMMSSLRVTSAYNISIYHLENLCIFSFRTPIYFSLQDVCLSQFCLSSKEVWMPQKDGILP